MSNSESETFPMNARAVIEIARSADISLKLGSDNQSFDIKSHGPVPDEIFSLIETHKNEIIEELIRFRRARICWAALSKLWGMGPKQGNES